MRLYVLGALLLAGAAMAQDQDFDPNDPMSVQRCVSRCADTFGVGSAEYPACVEEQCSGEARGLDGASIGPMSSADVTLGQDVDTDMVDPDATASADLLLGEWRGEHRCDGRLLRVVIDIDEAIDATEFRGVASADTDVFQFVVELRVSYDAETQTMFGAPGRFIEEPPPGVSALTFEGLVGVDRIDMQTFYPGCEPLVLTR